jgi:FkbM family methyltransferase
MIASLKASRPVKAVRSVAFTYAVFVVSRFRRLLPLRALGWMASAYRKAIENCSFDMRLNGESLVIERIASLGTFNVFLDVGANHGDWTREVLKRSPSATVHCFELAPPTFAVLQRGLASNPRIVLNNFGLADRNENVRIHFAPGDDGLTSLLTTQGDSSTIVIDAELRRGDDYLAAAGLFAVDFLKVDVEGAEPQVFDGLKDALASKIFRVVQFEYGHAQFALREFYRLFEACGYVVGKIQPDGCDFDGYRVEREPVASNYIAVRADQSDVLRVLAA